MRKAFGLAVVAAAFVAVGVVPPAAADMASVVAATYSGLSVSPPSVDGIDICHGFGCKYRDELGLTAADRATRKSVV